MILSKDKTHVLKGLFADEKCVYCLPFVSNTDNDTFVDMVATWEYAAINSVLTGTNDDDTTFNFGVVGFPKPPKRS